MTSPNIRREKLHTEEAVEIHLVDQLVSNQGWRERPYTAFDRANAIDPEMAAEFVRTTQPDAWSRLNEQYPGRAEAELSRQIASRLGRTAPRMREELTILGPAPAPLAVLRGRHRRRLLLKGP